MIAEAVHREHHHRDIKGGGARAAVFGASDGLVTNVSLILGLAGARPIASVVRLGGLAVLIGGALSMAIGEYVSMRAQTELLQRELEIERHEIKHRPEYERRELADIYEQRGIDPEVAHSLATEMMRDPELALETHAREELGIDPTALGSPLQAAVSSFVSFASGAVIPLIPWLITTGMTAVIASIAAAGFASILVGIALSRFTDRPWWKSAGRQLLLSAIAAGATYFIGKAVGISGVG